jgi:hypothetical protein
MGDCYYCKKPAGLFRSKHEECEQIRDGGLSQVRATIAGSLSNLESLKALPALLRDVAEKSYISATELRDVAVDSFATALEGFLDDGVLGSAEEKQLMELATAFNLDQADLDKKGAYTKVVKSAVLRDVMNGEFPERITINGSLPINFQKGEKIIWVFQNTEYLEDKNKRHYVGGSQGVGIRVMKGVYYRVGSFKGEAINTTERMHVDTGILVLTNKHMYFAGPAKSLRLPYSKIVSFQPFSDGVGIIRDAATAKPQIFVTGDGWFSYNLAANLAQL